jgi:hypothetical protein
MVGVTSYNIVARDLAGNEARFPTTGANKIRYNPSLVRVKVDSLFNDGSIVTMNQQQLSGTLETDRNLDTYSLTVNGEVAVIDKAKKTWTANFFLGTIATNDGLNDIQIVGSDGATSKVTMIYDPAGPETAIIDPTTDAATRNPYLTMKATDGTAVLLSINHQGNNFQVASQAAFNVNFDADGVYPIILTATDSNGLSNKVVRNIIHDTTPPVASFPAKYSSLQCIYDGLGQVISCSSSCPGGVCLQSSYSGDIEAGATVHLYDGSGNQLDTVANPVEYTAPGRKWSHAVLVSRDPYDTVIKVTDAAGNITATSQAHPDGNIKIDATFDNNDVDYCLSKVTAFGPSVPAGANLTFQELAHGDVAPLLNGNINPDGYLDIVDCIMISRKLNHEVVPF